MCCVIIHSLSFKVNPIIANIYRALPVFYPSTKFHERINPLHEINVLPECVSEMALTHATPENNSEIISYIVGT